ncbi:MAG: O-antigen ligase family protein [Phycisphaerae bacterium]
MNDAAKIIPVHTNIAGLGVPVRRWHTVLSWTALVGLLLIMCIRMTLPEPIGDGVWSGSLSFVRISSSTVGNLTGPAEVMGLGIVTLLLCGIAMLAAERMTPGKWLQLGLIAAVLAGAIAAIFTAANRFAALVGVFDLGMALVAGWGADILCDNPLRRRLVIVVLVGLLSAVTVKGIYQRYVEIPQTIVYFQKHQQQWLKKSAMRRNSAQVKLFISRLQSKEVSGFGILSDGFAEILIPLLLVGLALAGAALRSQPTTTAARPIQPKGKAAPLQRKKFGDVNLPDHLVLGAVLLLVSLAGVVVLGLTRSKGGAASFAICALLLVLAWWKRKWLAAHRRAAIAAVLVIIVIVTLGLLAYGVTHHGLPTKDLLYRWDYWTGAVRMIQKHPVTGVGLNNFGYYYTQYKPPRAPEDVKDPHNMFIRIAAEAGLPAAIGFVALVLWGFLAALREDHAAVNGDDQRALPISGLLAFSAAWFLGRLALDHPGWGMPGAVEYDLTLAALYAGAAVGGMLLANRLWRVINSEYRSLVVKAAVLGAAGMVLYDQINIALATGPAAMFFWIILGSFATRRAAYRHELGRDNRKPGPPETNVPRTTQTLRGGVMAGGVLCVFALLLGVMVWIPTVRGTLAWDPSLYRQAFKRAVKAKNWSAAVTAADAVLARNTRSQNWLERKIGVEMRMGMDPRRDVLKLLSINRTDARVRLPYALTSHSGLTVAQRIAQLKLALQLNSALPKDELERLSAQEVAEIHVEIRKLQSQRP